MLRGKLQVLVSLATIVAAACSSGGGAPAMQTAADSTAIREVGTKFQTAYNAGDVAAMGAMVTEDYSSTESDGTVINGRAAYEAAMKTEVEARKAMPATTLEITPGKVVFLTPTAATAAGTFSVKGVPAGMGPDKGSYLVVMTKGADAQWRMSTALVSPYVAPPAMPATPVKGG